jgi:glutamine---fructose-6-phosphate transaminase (isomerizing)
MCGIFAYIGDKQCTPLLLTGLKRLEYRGYDSAGIAVHVGEQISICKKVGKVQNLAGACSNNQELSGTMGIAHTRWATHGKPSDLNSHPHTNESKTITVVHNGIIENYSTLKAELQQKGYLFSSETDTELLPHLLEDIRNSLGPSVSWSVVVCSALQLVKGTYGVVFMFADSPDLLIGARKGSPLIAGIGDGEFMLASDAAAVVEHTKDVVYLRDGELIELRRKGGYRIRSVDAIGSRMLSVEECIHNPLVKLELSLEQIEKGGFKHFMLKEIIDQPNCLKNTLRGRLYDRALKNCESENMKNLSNTQFGLQLGGLNTDVGGETALMRMKNARRIIITACGTSWHSALIGEYLIEQYARIPVEVEYASEFRYRNPIIYNDDVIIAISQSGETADTLEAIRISKKFHALSIGIVNVVGSTIARETDAGVFLHAGPEIGVASTKAFTAQVMVLVLIALKLGIERGTLTEKEYSRILTEIDCLPELVQTCISETQSQIMKIAKYFRLASNFLFLGRGINFPVALEAALKLKEISYIHAEGYPAAEMKHGPIALIDNLMPVVVIAPKSDPNYEKVRSNIEQVKARSGELIIVTEIGNTDLDNFASEEFIIKVPVAENICLQPLLAVIPLQLLAYYIADLRGCSIDQPRNLAKSVTVE